MKNLEHPPQNSVEEQAETKEGRVEKLKCGIELPEFKDVIDEEAVEELRERVLKGMGDKMISGAIEFMGMVADVAPEWAEGRHASVGAKAEKGLDEVAESALGAESRTSMFDALDEFRSLVFEALVKKWKEIRAEAMKYYKEIPEGVDGEEFTKDMEKDFEAIREWFEAAQEFDDKLWEERFKTIPEEITAMMKEAVDKAGE